jgi:NAD+ diphosphatase
MHFSKLFTYCPTCGSSSFIPNNEKSMLCSSCGFVFYINASAAVATFIRNEAGELLVCKRAKEPAKGTLDLAGGFVDENETAEEAVSREIAEELQAKLMHAEYLFSLPNSYEYSGMSIPTLDLFFSCQLEDTTKLKPSDDVEDCFFLPLNEVKPSDFGLSSIRKGVQIFLNSKQQ